MKFNRNHWQEFFSTKRKVLFTDFSKNLEVYPVYIFNGRQIAHSIHPFYVVAGRKEIGYESFHVQNKWGP